jgi:hypothetical protein
VEVKTVDAISKAWAASHAAWNYEDDLRLQKLNRARGFSAEGTSLDDDDELLRGVPHELRHLVALAPDSDDEVSENPVGTFFAKLELNRLTGKEQSFQKTPDPLSFEDWLTKATIGEDFLNDRPILPTRTMLSDSGDLHKAAHLTVEAAEDERLRTLVEWIGRQLVRGENVERLAKFARDGGDEKRACEIEEIGAIFERQIAAAA